MNEDTQKALEKIKETCNFLSENLNKIKMFIGISVAVVLFLNSLLMFSSVSSAIHGTQKPGVINSPQLNIFSFLNGPGPKEDPNFKVDYDEKKAGHMYGAEFTKEKGIFGFIENYIQVYKIKKGVDRDFINTSKELEKQYQKH